MTNNKFLEKIKDLIEKQKKLNSIIIENPNFISGIEDNQDINIIQLLKGMQEEYQEINNVIAEKVGVDTVQVMHEGNLEHFKNLSVPKKDASGISFRNPINAFKNKQQVKFFKKQYKDLISILEIDFLTENYNDINYDIEKINKNIENELAKLKFNKIDDIYQNVFLNNMESDSKIQTIYTILWPTMHKKIKEVYKSLDILKEISKTNKDLSLVFEFSEKNNFDPDDVINILMQDESACDNIFSEQKGINKIKENYQTIFKNVNMFTVNTAKITNYLTTLFKVVEDMKITVRSLDISNDDKEQFIESINQSRIGVRNNKEIKYDVLQFNIEKLNNKATPENSTPKP